jgi:hypothetical protein
MPSEAKLDAILARFESAVATCAAPDDVVRTRLDLHRTIGTAGRTDAGSVAMIEGAVVPKKLWDAYAPRFAALLAALDARGRDFHAAERAELERRRVATLRLWYPASFSDPDTEEPFVDDAAFQLCDGIRDETDLDRAVGFTGSAALALPVEAVVRFDPATRALFVVIEVALERRPSADDIERINQQVEQALFRGWGLNHDFDFPEEVGEHVFHFEARPSRHEIA